MIVQYPKAPVRGLFHAANSALMSQASPVCMALIYLKERIQGLNEPYACEWQAKENPRQALMFPGTGGGLNTAG